MNVSPGFTSKSPVCINPYQIELDENDLPVATSKAFQPFYQDHLPQLKALNIDFPQRFSGIADLEKIIKYRLEYQQPSKQPLALIIYPKVDYFISAETPENQEVLEKNGKFIKKAFMGNDVSSLFKKGYRVLYYEVKTDAEFIDIIKTVGQYNKPDLLAIGGHGTKNFIRLGAAKNIALNKITENLFIDLQDKQKYKNLDLSPYIKSSCTLIVDSCGTGQGGFHADNIANFFWKIFKPARLVSPTQSTALGNFIFNKQGAVIGREFKCGKINTYERTRLDLTMACVKNRKKTTQKFNTLGQRSIAKHRNKRKNKYLIALNK